MPLHLPAHISNNFLSLSMLSMLVKILQVLGALSRHDHNPLGKQICQLLDFPGLAHKLHQQVKQNCRTTFFSVKLQFSCRDLGCL